MNYPKEQSSDDMLKPKYAKPSEREDEEISLPPRAEPNEGEQQLEEEEQSASPAGEEEDWEDELTGEKFDNPNLPSQRLAEFGMEEDLYPPRP